MRSISSIPLSLASRFFIPATQTHTHTHKYTYTHTHTHRHTHTYTHTLTGGKPYLQWKPKAFPWANPECTFFDPECYKHAKVVPLVFPLPSCPLARFLNSNTFSHSLTHT
jgi:hypothetical protein